MQIQRFMTRLIEAGGGTSPVGIGFLWRKPMGFSPDEDSAGGDALGCVDREAWGESEG
ncbi:hypothetical protein BVI2075_230135 [Burkholderia vietnamiensis]|nr:hypothetical protein BVI2075_230135 [Burkholderia vietnamiensis]